MPPTASFIYRTLQAKDPARVVFCLTSQQCIKVWLNGELVFDKKDANSTKMGVPDRIPLKLHAGTNQLLVKISSFFFGGFSCGMEREDGSKLGMQLSGDAAEILAAKTPATVEQRRLLEQFVRDASPIVKGLRDKIARGEGRLDFATQRPVPEHSEFLLAFGQPKRESRVRLRTIQRTNHRSGAATLERQGSTRSRGWRCRSLRANARRRLDRHPLSGGLLPLAERCRAAKNQAAPGAERSRREAVRDLIWVVVNTQEFLFQH